MFVFLKYIFASFLYYYSNSHLFRILNLIRSHKSVVEVDQSHQQAATNATKIGSDLSASALGWADWAGR